MEKSRSGKKVFFFFYCSETGRQYQKRYLNSKFKNTTVHNNGMVNIVAAICICETINVYKKKKIEKLKNF